MQKFKVSLLFIITTACLVLIFMACKADGIDMKSKNQQYPKYLKTPKTMDHGDSNSSLMLFRQIITKNITPYIGNHGAEKSPSIAVGLVTPKGDVVVGLGSRDIQKNTPPDGDTLFGIGSISKLFTGLILAKAVSDGDVALSTRANELLGKTFKIDDRITLRHLVAHYSGLPNFPENMTDRRNGSKDPEMKKLMPAKNYSVKNLESCLNDDKCKPHKSPGQQYLYSNLGIGLLGISLQNLYGYKDFNSLNQEKITHVLNMQHTATDILSFRKKYEGNFAQGYHYEADANQLKPVSFSNMGILAASGELISSVNDMNRFLKILTGLNSTSFENAVGEFGKELGQTDQPGLVTAYAHKIKRARDGGYIHSKTGLTAGYSAILLWRDNPKVGVIVLANRGKFRPLVSVSNRLMGVVTYQLIKGKN